MPSSLILVEVRDTEDRGLRICWPINRYPALYNADFDTDKDGTQLL
jgi:hypothetical protein